MEIGKACAVQWYDVVDSKPGGESDWRRRAHDTLRSEPSKYRVGTTSTGMGEIEREWSKIERWKVEETSILEMGEDAHLEVESGWNRMEVSYEEDD